LNRMDRADEVWETNHQSDQKRDEVQDVGSADQLASDVLRVRAGGD
jgi:hypothetical protein